MILIKLAWRNLWRRKRRTLITAFTVAFGVLMSVTFTGMGDYSYTQMINTGATLGFGHITIEPKGYNDSPTLDRRLGGVDDIKDRISSIQGISKITTRIIGQAMFASAAKNVGGAFLAIDPNQESKEYNLMLKSMVEGTVFSDSEGRGVVVGTIMAKKLNLRIGKKLVYTTTDIHGEIVSEVARVTGIFKTGSDEMDGSMVLLPIDRVRSTLNYASNEASIVSVIIEDQRTVRKIQKDLQKKVGNPAREILTWKETQADLAGIIALDRSGNYLMQILVGLLIAAGILNTILMSVLERTREFGMMMAVGMAPSRLFNLILLESFFIGLLGLGFGILITIPWYAYLNTTGIDFSAWVTENYSAGGVIFDPIMRIRLYKESILTILSSLFAITLVAGLYPAYRAGRIPPVESLKALY